MAKTIRVSDDTLSLMEKHGKPFETPDDCLKRVLSDHPCAKKESSDEENMQDDSS